MIKIHCDRDGCTATENLHDANALPVSRVPLGWSELLTPQRNAKEEDRQKDAQKFVKKLSKSLRSKAKSLPDEAAALSENFADLMELQSPFPMIQPLPQVETLHLCPDCTAKLHESL